jgi:hypothetical protein
MRPAILLTLLLAALSTGGLQAQIPNLNAQQKMIKIEIPDNKTVTESIMRHQAAAAEAQMQQTVEKATDLVYVWIAAIVLGCAIVVGCIALSIFQRARANQDPYQAAMQDPWIRAKLEAEGRTTASRDDD